MRFERAIASCLCAAFLLTSSALAGTNTLYRHTTDNSFAGSGGRGIFLEGSDLATDGTSAWAVGTAATLVFDEPFVLVTNDIYLSKVDISGGFMVFDKAIELKVNTDDTRFAESGADVATATGGGALIAGSTAGTTGVSELLALVRVTEAGTISWTKALGDSGFDNACSVIETSDGGFLVAGRTTSFSVGFDFDLLLVKLTSSGTVSWAKTYGTTFEERCGGLVETSDGGFVIAGETLSSTNATALVKVDSSGTLLWAKTYLSAGGAQDVIEAANGDLISCGTSVGTQTAAVILRVDSAGTSGWFRPVGRTGFLENEAAFGLRELSGGDLLAVGNVNESPAGLEPYLFRISSAGDSVRFSTKIDELTFNEDQFRTMELLPDGNFLAFGNGNVNRALVVKASSGGDVGCDGIEVVDDQLVVNTTGSMLSLVETSVTLTDWPHTLIETAIVDTDSTECEVVIVSTPEIATSLNAALSPGSPNPFASSTRLSFSLDRSADVTLQIYDVRGRQVRTLVEDRAMPSGTHAITFDGGRLPNGVYFAELNAAGVRSRQKIVLRR